MRCLKELIRTGISGSSENQTITIRVDNSWVFTNDDITAFPVLTKTCGGSNRGFAAGRAVCSELRCEIPYHNYPRGAKVELFIGAGAAVGTFYICERRIRGDRAELRARDIIALSDVPFVLPEERPYTVNSLLDCISVQLDVNIPSVENNYEIPENTSLKGSIRDMLGWCAASQGVNAYSYLNAVWVKPPFSERTVTIGKNDHSVVEIRSLFCGNIGKVRLKRSDCKLPEELRTVTVRKNGAVSERLQTYEDFGIYESGAGGRVLELTVPFANAEMAGNVLSKLSGASFGSAFSCKVCRLSAVPNIADKAVFADMPGKTFHISEMTVRFTGRGIFAALSSEGDSETEGRYFTRTERALAGKVQLDSELGGVEVCSFGEIRSSVAGSDSAVSFGDGGLSVYALEGEDEQS